MIKGKILVLAAITLLLLIGIYAAIGIEVIEGSTCISNSECGVNAVCSEGKCVSLIGTNIVECRTDKDCLGDERCHVPTGKCTSSSDLELRTILDSCASCFSANGLFESLMFVTNNEELVYDITLTYRKTNTDGTEGRLPMEYSPVIAYSPQLDLLYRSYTDAEGLAKFDFSDLVPEDRTECVEFLFLYCHAPRSCGLQQCLDGIGVNATERGIDGLEDVPTQERTVVPPASAIEPTLGDATPTSATAIYCPPAVANNLAGPALCLPLLLIGALLGGALYMSGRNPFAGFDLSSPRLHKPYQYGAHVRSAQVSVSGIVQAAGTFGSAARGGGRAAEGIKEGGGIAGSLAKGLKQAEKETTGSGEVFIEGRGFVKMGRESGLSLRGPRNLVNLITGEKGAYGRMVRKEGGISGGEGFWSSGKDSLGWGAANIADLKSIANVAGKAIPILQPIVGAIQAKSVGDAVGGFFINAIMLSPFGILLRAIDSWTGSDKKSGTWLQALVTGNWSYLFGDLEDAFKITGKYAKGEVIQTDKGDYIVMLSPDGSKLIVIHDGNGVDLSTAPEEVKAALRDAHSSMADAMFTIVNLGSAKFERMKDKAMDEAITALGLEDGAASGTALGTAFRGRFEKLFKEGGGLVVNQDTIYSYGNLLSEEELTDISKKGGTKEIRAVATDILERIGDMKGIDVDSSRRTALFNVLSNTQEAEKLYAEMPGGKLYEAMGGLDGIGQMHQQAAIVGPMQQIAFALSMRNIDAESEDAQKYFAKRLDKLEDDKNKNAELIEAYKAMVGASPDKKLDAMETILADKAETKKLLTEMDANIELSRALGGMKNIEEAHRVNMEYREQFADVFGAVRAGASAGAKDAFTDYANDRMEQALRQPTFGSEAIRTYSAFMPEEYLKTRAAEAADEGRTAQAEIYQSLLAQRQLGSYDETAQQAYAMSKVFNNPSEMAALRDSLGIDTLVGFQREANAINLQGSAINAAGQVERDFRLLAERMETKMDSVTVEASNAAVTAARDVLGAYSAGEALRSAPPEGMHDYGIAANMAGDALRISVGLSSGSAAIESYTAEWKDADRQKMHSEYVALYQLAQREGYATNDFMSATSLIQQAAALKEGGREEEATQVEKFVFGYMEITDGDRRKSVLEFNMRTMGKTPDEIERQRSETPPAYSMFADAAARTAGDEEQFAKVAAQFEKYTEATTSKARQQAYDKANEIRLEMRQEQKIEMAEDMYVRTGNREMIEIVEGEKAEKEKKKG